MISNVIRINARVQLSICTTVGLHSQSWQNYQFLCNVALSLKVTDVGRCSYGKFYHCDWTKSLNSSRKWVCVYLGCRLPEAIRDSKSLGWGTWSLQGWIFNFKGEGLWLRQVEVTTLLGILSRSLQPVWHGQWLKSHRFKNRRGLSQRWKTDRSGEDEGEKRLAPETLSVLVWKKS